MDILHISFINRDKMLNNNDILESLTNQEIEKLENFKYNTSLVLVSTDSIEDKINGDETINWYIFPVVRDKDVNCNAIFNSILALRRFLKEEHLNFDEFDDFILKVDQLENVEEHLTPTFINTLMDIMIDPNGN